MSVPYKVIVLTLLVGLLLTACDTDEGAAPPPSRADGHSTLLTPRQIRAMIPTRDELDMPLWGVMSPAEKEGGVMDNRQAAKETGLWNIRRTDLDAAGRLGGYVQYYWDGGCGGTCLERPLLTLRTEAHVFADERAASSFLGLSASRYRAQNDKPSRACGRVTVQEFGPTGIGDEVLGFRTRVSKCENLTGYSWRGTIFLFRMGRVVCLATATSLNDEYPSERAFVTANVLERRVDAVLSAP